MPEEMVDNIEDMVEDFEAPAEPEPKPEPQPEAKKEDKPADPAELRRRAEEELAKRYSIPEGDFDPRSHLPTYAAKLYLDIFDSVMGAVMQQMPTVVQQAYVAKQAEEQFFREFPSLRDPKYHASIIEAAKVVRSSGEKLTPEQARERVGRMVMAMHGLAQPVRPPVPAAPGASSGRRSEQPQNFWAELAEE